MDTDDVDRIVAQWRAERSDLDLDTMELFGRLAHLFAHLSLAVDMVFTRHALQRGEYDVLAALRRSGRPFALMPSELADTLMLSRAGMTNRLDRLVAAGLVVRTAKANDRRSMLIKLTPDGLALTDTVTTEHVANEAKLLSPLSRADRAALNRIARTLLSQFEPSSKGR